MLVMEGKIRNFLICVIMLVTVYTEAKALTNHDIEEELRVLSHDVSHLRKAGKEQADVIRQLQNTVEKQSVRISMLSETLKSQQSVIRKHNNEIEKLKKENSDLAESLMKEIYKPKDFVEDIRKIKYKLQEKTTRSSGYDFRKDNERAKAKKLFPEIQIGQVKMEDPEDKLSSKRERERTYNNKPAIQNHGEEGGDLTRKYRLLSPVPTQSIPEETIAFYAYMSADMNGIGSHHTLGFDVVKTNEGNGFHGNTGVFNPPKSGLYVFSWTLRVMKGAYHSVELVVNHDVVGSTYHIENYSFDQGGATVVIFCNKGDDIYLRTGANYNVGPITSEERGRSSFAGWKL